jgi:hypothetical protein
VLVGQRLHAGDGRRCAHYRVIATRLPDGGSIVAAVRIFLRSEHDHERITTVEMPHLPRVGEHIRQPDGTERPVTRVTWIVAGDHVETWEIRLGVAEA